MRDVPVGELVNEWTHVTSEPGPGPGDMGDDGPRYGYGATTEHSRQWAVSMSVGSRRLRRYMADAGVGTDVDVDAETQDEGHSADTTTPFKLRVEDRYGTLLWDMAWSWGCV